MRHNRDYPEPAYVCTECGWGGWPDGSGPFAEMEDECPECGGEIEPYAVDG